MENFFSISLGIFSKLGIAECCHIGRGICMTCLPTCQALALIGESKGKRLFVILVLPPKERAFN